jgi:hypothetical protein
LWLAFSIACDLGGGQTQTAAGEDSENIPKSSATSGWQALLALAAIFANVLWLGFELPRWPTDHSSAWRKLDALIASHREVYTAPHLSHLLHRHGLPFYDSGQTEFVPFVFQGNSMRIAGPYLEKAKAFLEDIRQKIVHRQFDLVLTCRGWSPLLPVDDLESNYVSQGLLPAPMAFGYWMDPYPLEVWIPRAAAGSAAP